MSDAQRQTEVRRQVRQLLERSPAYRSLGADDRRDLANNMVRVGTYLADPSWLAESTPARAAALAESEPVQDLKGRLAAKPGQIGAEFQAGALKQGVEQFANLVQTVDFPAFVSGLVQGVFKAVVDASIEQMQAYAELMAAAVKSTEQFASDHVSDGEVRDQIAARYPGQVEIDTSQPGPARLRIREDAGELDLGRDYGLGHSVDLSDRDSEAALVAAAKLELARSRQQMTATMMLLGINRIVVTDGKLTAKVMYDFQARDNMQFRKTAQQFDYSDKTVNTESVTGGTIQRSGPSRNVVRLPNGTIAETRRDASFYTTGDYKSVSQPLIQMTSVTQTSADASLTTKASLAGTMEVNFKSDYVPLDKLANPESIAAIQMNAQPGMVKTLATNRPPAPAAAGGGASTPTPAAPTA